MIADLCTLASLALAPASAPQETVTTESGLKYEVLEPGDGGERPTVTSFAKVHYTGTFENGDVFDSSRERGQPAVFSVGGVIPGWTEGLQLMTRGARYRFVIPPELGYGERGQPPAIPPSSTLLFDVELIDFSSAMVPPDPEQSETLGEGVLWQVVEPGQGEPAGEDGVLSLDFTVWTAGGDLMAWSGNPQVGAMKAKPANLPPLFMKGIGAGLRAGSTHRFRAPANQAAPGLPQETVWLVHVTGIGQASPTPEFVLPSDEELTALPSGLKYQVLKEGEGERPTVESRVKVHYAGWLTDGKLFDASYNRGEPAEFAVLGVVQGWQEGLQLMSKGAVYRFVIPPELAYGPRPRPEIPANSTLVFHVELLEIQ